MNVPRKHKLTLSHGLAWQNAADYSISTLNERIIRWTMMRVRHSVPSWLQPLAECFLQGLYGAWIIYYFTSDWQNTILFFLLHIVIWFLFDFTLLQILEVMYIEFSIYIISTQIFLIFFLIKIKPERQIQVWHNRMHSLLDLSRNNLLLVVLSWRIQA